MKNRTCAILMSLCVVILFVLYCCPLSVSGAEDQPLPSVKEDQTYATIPHADNSSNETFVTVFTVGFMILLIIVCAFVMYYKR